jgi:hypothetical protein
VGRGQAQPGRFGGRPVPAPFLSAQGDTHARSLIRVKVSSVSVEVV